MRIRTAVLAACLGLSLASCGSDQKPIEIKGAKAMGSVGGLVLDAATREPLEGVTVTLVAGSATASMTTDATGAFSFSEVPSGDVVVTLSKSGYLSAAVTGTLMGAGEYPITNASLTLGPFGLIPATGTFQAVLVYENGAPAGDVPVTARTHVRYYNYGAAGEATADAQTTVVSARTDGTGLVRFSGLPDFALVGEGTADQVTLVVPPIPAPPGSPAMYTYPGGSFVFHMTAVASQTPVVVLTAGSPQNLSVVASSLASLEASGGAMVPTIVPRGGPIFITFNQPLDPVATTVTLLDEGTPSSLAADKTAMVQKSVVYNTLQLSFSPELAAASEYNLVIHAVSSMGDRTVRYDGWAPFFTEVPTTLSKPTMTREVIDPVNHIEVIHLVFPEPVGTGAAVNNVFQNQNCVLFFSVPLTAENNEIGDDPGETGNAACRGDLVLQAEEPDPPGMAGTSGYTKYWKFNLPVLAGPSSVPQGTPVNIVFSRVPQADRTMRRVTGEPVADLVGPMNLTLP